jgi:hypothetical protein
MNLIKLRCTYKEKEAYHYIDLLCCFGLNDLSIHNNCNINYNSNSKLGNAYYKPSDSEEEEPSDSREIE